MDARYRLAPMRDARAREERVKQGDLAGEVGEAKALAAEVETATRRVEQLRTQLARATRSRGLALTRGVTVGALAGAERHLDRLRGELDAALGALARAEARHAGQLDAVATARARLGHARAQRELIERHFATWRAQRQQLAERRED